MSVYLRAAQNVKVWLSIFVLLLGGSIAGLADNTPGPVMSGMTAFRQQNFDLAITYFSRAIRLNTNYLGAYYYRGLSYMQEKQFGKSIADFSHALSLNTNNADAWYFRGLSYM